MNDQAKTQTLILMEAVKELKEAVKIGDERTRVLEKSHAETKIYYKNILDKLIEIKSGQKDQEDRISVLENKGNETKGTFKGLAIASSLGGGVGALIAKLFTGGSH